MTTITSSSSIRTVLGIPYDPALDVWSVGCTLYELYTGKILLPGRSNNQMLLLMMELKGRFNQKMIKKAKFGDSYFDEMGGFDSIERDRVTGAVCWIFSCSCVEIVLKQLFVLGRRAQGAHLEAGT
jgi:serine/threonine protein kinase